ncbi:MAG: hypothetical protein LBT89_03245 [Planctomycetaceae bacterium]|jgi:hypothetical protein|nr:hypothetical protein [Planctomycetaceae bacterium]
MKRHLLTLCVLFFSVSVFAADALDSGFQKPPTVSRIWAFWWWLNGNVTEESITSDLEGMKKQGFGGALIFDAGGAEQNGSHNVPAGPMFGTEPWIKLFKHTLKEADRLGLSVSLNIQSGWNLGSPFVQPEHAAKMLTFSEITVKGGQQTITLPQPAKRGNFYQDIAAVALPKKPIAANEQAAAKLAHFAIKTAVREFGGSAPNCLPLVLDEPESAVSGSAAVEECVVVTENVPDDGKITWDVPAGEWTLIRFGYTLTGSRISTSSGKWQGLTLDYLDADAFRWYWNKSVQPLLDDAGNHCGKTLRYLHSDSWECGGMNWSPNFAAEFKKRRGYDLLPYLPVIAGKILTNRNISNRFLNDFRRTIGDCAFHNHYVLFKELAAKNHLGIHPESGGPHGAPIDSLQFMGLSDIPASEFWSWSPQHRIGDANRFFVKQPASAAHVFGKKLVAAEGFTNIGLHWQESFSDNLKPSFDQALCEGFNLLMWHAFTNSPKEMGLPGQEYFAGTHFNPNHTVFPYSQDFCLYLDRCQFLLQQGLFAADVLEYYGENVPNFTQWKGQNTAGSLPGYDYDVAPENAMLERVAVKDGRIILPDGMNYKLLVLPKRDSISLAVLQKLAVWVEDGGLTVIGPKPKRITGLANYPEADKEVQQLADKLWGKSEEPIRQAGKGRIITGLTAREVLQKDGLAADFERVTGTNPKHRVDSIHRIDGGTDIYFVANLSAAADTTECAFRVTGKQPEIWNALTGEIRQASAFRQESGRTFVPIHLASYGSVFIVFRNSISGEKQGVGGSNEPSVIGELPINGAWEVSFDPKWGGPEKAVFETLIPWNKHEDKRIKYYSGSALYRKTVNVPAEQIDSGCRFVLQLGNVSEIAAVRLNGVDLGTVWAHPFQLDLTKAVKAGDNVLEIEAVNHWANRIIGDASLPEAERLTKTNVSKLTQNTALVESGLIGPAVILQLK